MKKLVHISDLHFGALEPGLPDALRQAITAEHPDLLIASGDFSQHGTRAELRKALAFLHTLPEPQLRVPGNHDIPHGWHLWSRFFHTFENYRKEIQPDLEPSWRNSWCYVAGLNSVRAGGWYWDWSRGALSSRQLEQLSRTFADSPSNALRVLVVHHPLAAPPQGTHRHLLDPRRKFFRELGRVPIDLILSGHFHQSYALPVMLPTTTVAADRAVVLSVASTATSHRRQGEPNGFHIIECEPNQLVIRTRMWDGACFAHGPVWPFARDDAGQWRPAGLEEAGNIPRA